MKAVAFVSCLSFILFFSFADVCASDSLHFVRRLPLKARYFTTDPLDQIYLVLGRNTLMKCNDEGDSLFTYNEIHTGALRIVDAGNPLRIVLYYPDENKVTFLNTQLSSLAEINLNDMGFLQVNCVANSYDGGLWVYQQAAGLLVKLDAHYQEQQRISLYETGENPAWPCTMTERDRFLYFSDTVSGIRKFDLYGYPITVYPYKTHSFQLISNILLYVSKDTLHAYQPERFSEKTLALPDAASILEVRMGRKYIYILRKESLDIYTIVHS